MLDTVRLGIGIPGVRASGLYKRGWSVTQRRTPRGSNCWADVDAEGVRLGFLGGVGWLTAECSLPRLVVGDNAVLLAWDDCAAGLELIRERACDAVGLELPAVVKWRMARFDAVAGWPAAAVPYIAALRWLVRLPRTEVVSFLSGIQWVTPKSHRVRCRVYDKSLEAGREVEAPLRLERQVRPRREVVRVNGKRVGVHVGEVTREVVSGLLADTLSALRLDRPVMTSYAARERLVGCYGTARGSRLYGRMLEVGATGGWPTDLSKRARRRFERDLEDAGVGPMSIDVELPGLAAPE